MSKWLKCKGCSILATVDYLRRGFGLCLQCNVEEAHARLSAVLAQGEFVEAEMAAGRACFEKVGIDNVLEP